MAFEKGFDLGQYTQREVAQVTAFLGANANIETATPLFKMGYSTSVTAERTADRTYANRAGSRANAFDGGKTTTVTISTQYYTMQHFAQMAGKAIEEGNQDIFHVDTVKVKDGGVVTLTKTPVGVGEKSVSVLPYVNGMVKRRPQTVTDVDGKNITLDLTDEYSVEVGDEVQVYYQHGIPESYTLDFLENRTPPIVTLVLDVFYTDFVAGVIVPGQIIYYAAQIRQDSTMAFSSDGDPGTLDLVYDIYVTEVDGESRTQRMIIYNDVEGDYNWIDVKYVDQLQDENND